MVLFQELKIRKFHPNLRVPVLARASTVMFPSFLARDIMVREAKENFTLRIEKENTRKTLKVENKTRRLRSTVFVDCTGIRSISNQEQLYLNGPRRSYAFTLSKRKTNENSPILES